MQFGYGEWAGRLCAGLHRRFSQSMVGFGVLAFCLFFISKLNTSMQELAASECNCSPITSSSSNHNGHKNNKYPNRKSMLSLKGQAEACEIKHRYVWTSITLQQSCFQSTTTLAKSCVYHTNIIQLIPNFSIPLESYRSLQHGLTKSSLTKDRNLCLSSMQ